MKPMVLTLLLVIVTLQLAMAAPTYRVFVSNEEDNSLSVIDSRNNKVETTVAVG